MKNFRRLPYLRVLHVLEEVTEPSVKNGNYELFVHSVLANTVTVPPSNRYIGFFRLICFSNQGTHQKA